MNNLQNLSNEQLNLLSSDALRALRELLNSRAWDLSQASQEERANLRELENRLNQLLGQRRWSNQ